MTLHNGTRVLGVPAAPGRDDGPGLHPTHADDDLEQRLAGCEADLVIVGHTHVPMDCQVGSIRVINLGSVSNPVTPDLQATYGLLEADAAGYRLQVRRVEYDREAVISAIKRVRHPTPALPLRTHAWRAHHPILIRASSGLAVVPRSGSGFAVPFLGLLYPLDGLS